MDNDDLIFMCRVYHRTRRDKEFLETVKTMIEIDPCFDKNRRYLFQLVYKQIIDAIREMLRTLTSYLDVEEGMQRVEMVKSLEERKENYINKLIPLCNEAIDTITDTLLPNAESVEAEIFFIKFKADLYRYISEFSDETESLNATKSAENLYSDAVSMATSYLPACHPTYLGTFLNAAVFQFEHKKNNDLAITFCQDGIKNYDESLAELDPDSRDEAREMLKLMQKNLEHWNSSEEEDGE